MWIVIFITYIYVSQKMFQRRYILKCVLCKKEDNNIKHVKNECEIMKELRDKSKNELEKLDRKTINLNILKVQKISIILKIIHERKKKRKRIKKGIREIKKFIRKL